MKTNMGYSSYFIFSVFVFGVSLFCVYSVRNNKKVFLTCWRLYKFCFHLISGKSEIHRICLSWFDGKMVVEICRSLRYSKQLKNLTIPLFNGSVFEVDQVVDEIVQKKKIKSNQNNMILIKRNLNHSLNGLLFINKTMIKIKEIIATEFDPKKQEHEELLESFWNNLKPETRRSSDERWTDLGFQNSNPSSDFRGMGLFGLVQLVYFSQMHTTQAQNVLLISSKHDQYFPFAVCGINLSNFVVDLLKLRYLDQRLLDGLLKKILEVNITISENSDLVTYGVNIVH